MLNHHLRTLRSISLCMLAIFSLLGTSQSSFAECSSGSDSSFITKTSEPGLPNSVVLTDGLNTTVNTSVPGQISVDAGVSSGPTPMNVGFYSAGSTFTPANNSYTNVLSATSISLPPSGSTATGVALAFTLSGSMTTININANGTDKINFNGSPSSFIPISNGDQVFLVNLGSGNWGVTSFVPYGGAGSRWTVTQGGTGRASLSNNLVLLGNGTGGINTVASTGTTGQVLTSNGPGADPTFQNSGGGGSGGGIATIGVTSVTAPGKPTVTVTGTAGSTAYQYLIVAIDANGNAAPGMATLVTTGNATLTSSNYNALSWTSTGAASYDVYRIAGPSNVGKITNTTSTSYNDQSNSTGDNTFYPTQNFRKVSLATSAVSTQLLDCSNGNIVITLPTASSAAGLKFSFKRTDSTTNSARIVASTGETIGLAKAEFTLFNRNALTIQSNSTSTWEILGFVRSIGALPLRKLRGSTDWGINSMLVMGSDGDVYGWGISTNSNTAGNISSGTELVRPVIFDPNSLPASGTFPVDWAATSDNLFVVLSDGTVYGAGLNGFGQLGLGNTTDSKYLQKITFFNTIPIAKVWSFSGGASTNDWTKTFFLTRTGQLYACGYNATGTLGIGNTTSPTSTPALVSGVYNPIDLKSGHTLSGDFTLLCDANGDLWGTGYNTNGQLGNSSSTQLNAFTKITVSGASSIKRVFAFGANASNTAAAGYSAVLDSNGVLFMAGKNTSGQLGQGNTTTNSTFGWFKVGGVSTYSTGTASCSGTAVTGTGTSWTSIPATATSLQIGFGASPSTWYSIASINSNTSITLQSTGPTVSAGSYVIRTLPLSNTVIDFAFVGGANSVGCEALDSAGNLWTWGGNTSNYLFYANTSTQAAPSVVATGVKLISSVNSPTANANANGVFYDGNKLRIGGTALNGFIGVSDTSYTSGSTVLPLPASIYRGSERIVDLFVNNNSAAGRIFILTDLGNLYASGDNTNGICTGGATTADPVGMFRIDLSQ